MVTNELSTLLSHHLLATLISPIALLVDKYIVRNTLRSAVAPLFIILKVVSTRGICKDATYVMFRFTFEIYSLWN